MTAPLSKASLQRLLPIVAVVVLSIAVVAAGWHREVSFETLARHYDSLREFVLRHEASAVAAFVALYAAAVALSLPVGVYLTVIGGVLFGTVVGGAAAVLGASIGAICIFLLARWALNSGLGDWLTRRAGATGRRIAQGFRADALSYLLFLRLVPVFPFWLVNLVPALCGVGLLPFAAATFIGIMPAAFAFAFVGSGLNSAIMAQSAAYQACLASGSGGCRLAFRFDAAFTPELIGALVMLGVLALVPPAMRRWRAHS
jgi:uncharacterized membrane protein YdjX (TVP38/TMEM64 family)